MSMYIKIKRQRQTIFLNCEPGDTIISLKQKIKAINSVPAEDQRLIVPEDKVVCDDNKVSNLIIISFFPPPYHRDSIYIFPTFIFLTR
mmetsp:Transcript_31208/g.83735  ORF Transcript_31208/g.83735 Transcript_31208/m.83735 type:complete len:88 (-) Transcript_31208:424-687(-)